MQKEATGIIRVEASTLKTFQKTKKGWKHIQRSFPELKYVVSLFKGQRNMAALLDAKNPRWLKGQVSVSGMVQGARVSVMPNGEILDKAFSLFAKGLRLHDQDSHDHWDVMFQNKGGTWAYGYTKEKVKQHKNKKFKKVAQFDKVYTLLLSNVAKGLRNKDDHVAVPVYTLLKTYMRVGNETYFNAHGHKGLTTLLKKDVSVKGNNVVFKYLGKDGVPRHIDMKFSPVYVRRLKGMLKGKKNEFVFSNCKTGKPICERVFKKAFLAYCGKEFYPHIVRSHYATSKVQSFLKGKRKVSKSEVDTLYKGIAHNLGHRKFVKKKGVWEDNYSVTVSHYIQPSLVERVAKITR